MKKLIVLLMVSVLVFCVVGCGKSKESNDSYYFIGEIVGQDTYGGIVKVVDYGGHDFNSPEVILHEVTVGQDYSIGDYVRVEFDGYFIDTLTPQIKTTISIEKIDTP